MRIVVNDIAASIGGAMTVLRDFYACVCENDKENEWIFLLGEKYFEETQNVKIVALPEVKKSSVKKLVFDFFTGRSYIGKLNPDVVISMQNIITFGLLVPQVVYVHQSLPFQRIKRFSFLKSNERSSAIKQYLVGGIIKQSIKKADCTIVQTEWMREAVIRDCSVAPETVVKCMPENREMPVVNSHVPFDPTLFFYPTNASIYKNIQLLFDASEILDRKGLNHRIQMTIDPSKSKGSVQCTGRLSFEQVVESYQRATLVFPSYIETFGYPLAEARKMGAIVLAADTPFAREVLAGYENAYFFQFDQAEELADLMHRVMTGDIQRKLTAPEMSADNTACGWRAVMETVYEAARL